MSLDDERNSGPFGGSGETRTRLPEGEGEIRRTSRPGRTSSRSLVTVVGIVVLLIAAIAFANRGDGGSDGATGDEKKPDAAATAPSGEKPVEGKNGGIPSGFADTEQGAQSAAANFAVSLGSAEMFDKDKRDVILETVMAPSSLPEFRSDLDKAYGPAFYKNVGLNEDGSTPSGYQFVSRTTPIGTKVTDFSKGKATVEVWCSGLLGLSGEKSTKPVTSSWFTITMELTWIDGDWKAVDHTQKTGPAPVPGDDRASGSDEISKAVEGYGGFTYAR